MSDYADSGYAGWDLGKRICNSCEGYYRDIENGLCRGCRGEDSYDPERTRQATAYLSQFKSEASFAAEAWAERELARGAELRRAWNAKRFNR